MGVEASHAGERKEALPNPIRIIIGYILNS